MESTMQILLSIATTVMTGIIGWLFHKLKKHEELREIQEKKRLDEILTREKAVNNALRALCHDRILESYKDCKHQNCISAQELEMINKLYEAYHALGGNGTITSVYERITKLPIKED